MVAHVTSGARGRIAEHRGDLQMASLRHSSPGRASTSTGHEQVPQWGLATVLSASFDSDVRAAAGRGSTSALCARAHCWRQEIFASPIARGLSSLTPPTAGRRHSGGQSIHSLGCQPDALERLPRAGLHIKAPASGVTMKGRSRAERRASCNCSCSRVSRSASRERPSCPAAHCGMEKVINLIGVY